MKELVDHLLSAAEQLPEGARFMLGIAGIPGAGKSTLATSLEAALNDVRPGIAVTVPMDGFHLSNEVLCERGLLELKGIPATFDAHSFVQLMQNVRKVPAQLVLAPLFDRSIEASVEDAIAVGPEKKIVLVEGNYLLLQESPWAVLKDLLDEVWFVAASYETVLPRLIERHCQGGRTESGAYEKIQCTDLPNAVLVEKTRVYAHRAVDFQLGENGQVAAARLSECCKIN